MNSKRKNILFAGVIYSIPFSDTIIMKLWNKTRKETFRILPKWSQVQNFPTDMQYGSVRKCQRNFISFVMIYRGMQHSCDICWFQAWRSYKRSKRAVLDTLATVPHICISSVGQWLHPEVLGTSCGWVLILRITQYFPGITQIARLMGPTWDLPGADRTQVGPMLAPSTLLSGYVHDSSCVVVRHWLILSISYKVAFQTLAIQNHNTTTRQKSVCVIGGGGGGRFHQMY